MYFFEGCILYIIYTHIVYMLLRVACTYAQLFGNRRLAKSLIGRSIVPFGGLFTLALLFRNFKYDVIGPEPPYYTLLTYMSTSANRTISTITANLCVLTLIKHLCIHHIKMYETAYGRYSYINICYNLV